MEELITIEGLAKLLPLKLSTLRRMCRQQQIPCYKIGGIYFFRQTEIEDWLRSRQQKVIGSISVNLIRDIRVRCN
jgi:excisionase family DNA binding protein